MRIVCVHNRLANEVFELWTESKIALSDVLDILLMSQISEHSPGAVFVDLESMNAVRGGATWLAVDHDPSWLDDLESDVTDDPAWLEAMFPRGSWGQHCPFTDKDLDTAVERQKLALMFPHGRWPCPVPDEALDAAVAVNEMLAAIYA